MGFPQGRALIVGVANYAEVSRLPEAVLADARDFGDVLRAEESCGYPAGHVRLLLDGAATLDAIRDELSRLAAVAGPDDTVVIFFSGHGARLPGAVSALVPVDARLSDLVGSTLGEAEFSAALAAIPAHRLLVLLDACHSGGAGTFKDVVGSGGLGLAEKSLERLSRGAGRVLIASSRANETSMILAGARNSAFTGQLLDGLRGGVRADDDGLIRVLTLFEYVAEQVHRVVPGLQHPVLKASAEDNYPIALHRGGRKAPGASPVSARPLEELLPDLYPTGPTEMHVWQRAGGEVARLRLTGHGRADWYGALRTLRLGGGGREITLRSLIDTVLEDFPHHPEL